MKKTETKIETETKKAKNIRKSTKVNVKKTKKDVSDVKKTSTVKKAVKKGVTKKTTPKKATANSKSVKTSVKKVAKTTKSTEKKKPVKVAAKKNTKGVIEKNVVEKKDNFAEWKAPDFVRTIEETYLYYISLIASLFIIPWFFINGEIMPALTFLILFIVVVLELRSKARKINYEVNLHGVLIDGNLIKFEDIRSFDIVNKAGFNVVRLQMKSAIFPIKEVFLDEKQDLVYIESLFEYFLPKEKQEEKLFNFQEKKEFTEDELIDKIVDEYMDKKF